MAETPKLDDAPLGQCSEPRHRLIEGDAASFATSEGSSKHQHLFAEVAELLGFDAELLPSRINVVPEPPVALMPVVDDPLGSANDRRTNLNLGIENCRRRSLVLLGKRREEGLDDLDVLLRHRLRSISPPASLSGCWHSELRTAPKKRGAWDVPRRHALLPQPGGLETGRNLREDGRGARW